MATRTLVLDVEDHFGVVSHHTIPLMGDKCPHCGTVLGGSAGSPDIEASVAQVIASVEACVNDVIAKLEKVDHPEIKKLVEGAKAKRDGHRAPGQN